MANNMPGLLGMKPNPPGMNYQQPNTSGMIDFNAMAQQLAGPMPELPQMPSPIRINGGMGGGGPTPGMMNDLNPPFGNNFSDPNGYNPVTGMNPMHDPATLGGGPASSGVSNSVYFGNYGIAPSSPMVMGWPGGPSAPGGPGGPFIIPDFLLEPSPAIQQA